MQLAHARRIGLAQRFLLSFANSRAALRHRLAPCGPAHGGAARKLELAAQQEEEVENLPQIHALSEDSARKVFRQAMPQNHVLVWNQLVAQPFDGTLLVARFGPHRAADASHSSV